MKPAARANLVIEELSGETLVYDRERHRAHCLDTPAAFLLRSADGNRTVGDLSRLAGETLGSPLPEDAVEIGLERLARARLLEWTPDPSAGITRKAAIRRMALAGVALPSVLTVVAPTPAQAVTLIPPSACNAATEGQCCTNHRACRRTGASQNFKCNGPAC